MLRSQLGPLLLLVAACGGKAQTGPEPAGLDASDERSESHAIDSGAATSDTSRDVEVDTADVSAACVAFCRARQIHIDRCAVRDGDRGLTETFQECAGNFRGVHDDISCPTGPSCGGWLSGCLDDPPSAEATFPAGTTCADSVARGLFRP